MPLAEEIRANGLEESVTHISHIPQDRLAVLYSTTLAFVLPTTHEGLSATMLEAMACGAPVLTVDHAPLHDGLFEHVWALDAPEVGLLRDALVRLANEESKGNSLRQLGLECASRFSWSRTAKETIEACWEAGQKH
jgi:glycosyltransferase involved in cell wall biosynthesis